MKKNLPTRNYGKLSEERFSDDKMIDGSVPIQVRILREINKPGAPALRVPAQQWEETAYDEGLKQLIGGYQANKRQE